MWYGGIATTAQREKVAMKKHLIKQGRKRYVAFTGYEEQCTRWSWNERVRYMQENYEGGQHIEFFDDFSISDVIAGRSEREWLV